MHLTLRAARASIRSAHRELVFNRAIARFMHSPTKAVLGSHGVVNDLIYGWGNEGWSAHHEYLAACVESALGTSTTRAPGWLISQPFFLTFLCAIGTPSPLAANPSR